MSITETRYIFPGWYARFSSDDDSAKFVSSSFPAMLSLRFDEDYDQMLFRIKYDDLNYFEIAVNNEGGTTFNSIGSASSLGINPNGNLSIVLTGSDTFSVSLINGDFDISTGLGKFIFNTNQLVADPADGVGIGIATTSNYRLKALQTKTDASCYGIHSVTDTTITDDLQLYTIGIYADCAYYSVASGKTNSGYCYGILSRIYANDSDFQGTLAIQAAGQFTSGLYSCGSGATITNCYGLNVGIQNYDADGTITNAYGVYIDSKVSATGTFTNTPFDLYCAEATAYNYFAGNVGIKNTAPSHELSISGDAQATGHILSSGATSGIGYATGAGNTVTQDTSKSTTVTINAVCGTITTHNATLNAGTIVSFQVTNSAIAATDVITVQHDSGGTLGAYTINTSGPASGHFHIDIRNNTADNLGEALVIRFAVIKAVVS